MSTSMLSAFGGAIRALRRRPGFFAIAVSSLGIALGLSTAVFAMIDALKFPLASNEGVDQIFGVVVIGRPDRPMNREAFAKELERLPGVQSLTLSAYRGPIFVNSSSVDRWRGAAVLPNYFSVLGLTPARGRLLAGDDFTRGNAIVVSHNVWRQRFNDRQNIDSATLTLDQKLYSVVGVLAPHAQAADIIFPTTYGEILTGRAGTNVIVRLKDRWTPERMRPDLEALNARLIEEYGRGLLPLRISLGSIRPEGTRFKDIHFAMIGAAIGILLIACANVAALMLARGVGHRRDYALHLALGAKPLDLTRGVIAEVAVIAVCGAIVGTIIAAWTTQIMTLSVPENLNNLDLPTPQWSLRVFGLSFATMLAAIALASAGPAWLAARTNPQEPLKESAGTTTGRAGTRFRFLVITEVAVCMALLMGSSLMAKQVRVLANFDPGYDPKSLLRATIAFPFGDALSPEQRVQAVQSSIDRFRADPDIDNVAIHYTRTPDSATVTTEFTASGGPRLVYAEHDAYTVAGPGFFATLGVAMSSGRDFSEGDRIRGAIVLSESAARALFPRADAIGRLVKLGDDRSVQPWYPVIGIVRDVAARERNDRIPVPDVYAFVPDSNPQFVALMLRARSDPARVAVEAARTLEDLAPAGSRTSVRPLLYEFDRMMRTLRYVGRLFVLLGVASLVLAAAGLFSVLSYVVSQRMREFAVRMALGARRPDVVRLVVGDAMVMALGGTAIGALLGMWSSFFIWDILVTLYPVDAEALVIAEVTLIAATLIACIVPALRAMRANPVDVMRAT